MHINKIGGEYMKKYCKNCNKEISSNKDFCSKSCKDKYNYNNKVELKNCIICNKQFKGKRGQKVCSDKCKLRSQKKYFKICPICHKKFKGRGNSTYCSNTCYRISNDKSKGNIIKECLVCGKLFKNRVGSSIATCGPSCSSKLLDFTKEQILIAAFGTKEISIIKKEII